MTPKRLGDTKPVGGRGSRQRLRAADVVLTSTSVGLGSGGGESNLVLPVRCSIAAYGLSGAHVSRHFPNGGRVWQVQVEHPAKPSMTYAMLKNWLDYKNVLRRAAGREEASSLECLEKEDAVRVVLTGADDEHGCDRARHARGRSDGDGPRSVRLPALPLIDMM